MNSGAARKTVAIAGGGLAGLAAGCALSDAGFEVTLYERRPYLGGRASSYEHPGTGEVVDNCQHVLLGCCTSLIDLYRRIGVEDKIRWYDCLTFIEPGGRTSEIAGTGLPAPLHNAPSFLRAPMLSLQDKLAITRAMFALMPRLPKDDGTDFLTWLKLHGQTDRAIERFWKTILVSALNEDLDRVSVSSAALVFRESFLKSARAGHMGVPTVPLTELYSRAGEYIEAHGGHVELRTSVDCIQASIFRKYGTEVAPYPIPADPIGRRLSTAAPTAPGSSMVDSTLPDPHSADSTTAHVCHPERSEGSMHSSASSALLDPSVKLCVNGREVLPDYAVLALPFDALARVLPNISQANSLRQSLERFETSPITGVHLWFDRNITNLDHAVLLDRTIQWMFHKSQIQVTRNSKLETGNSDSGSYVELVISASKSLVSMSRAEIIDLAVRELTEFFPAVRDSQLLKATVIKEIHATFSPLPGSDSHRPGPQTPWPQVFLAGDWTSTGWPATMEGAVRSGYLAAEAVCRAAGISRRFLAPDLPPAGLMRLFR